MIDGMISSLPVFVDSHAHLSDPEVLPHIEGLLMRAKDAHIEQIVNICTDIPSLKAGIQLQTKYPWIKLAAAIPPHTVEEEGNEGFSVIKKHVNELVAIGETGLDYREGLASHHKSLQQSWTVRYLHLAQETHLPVVFHCRNAFEDLFALCDQHYQGNAIIHCFTGNSQEALQAIERGWYLSFSGILTFKKSEALREVAKKVPLEHLLIETDTPYLAPQTRRGKPNEPAFLIETAECLASIKGVSLGTIAEITTANAKKVFSLS